MKKQREMTHKVAGLRIQHKMGFVFVSQVHLETNIFLNTHIVFPDKNIDAM